jgi:hypothetical protein
MRCDRSGWCPGIGRIRDGSELIPFALVAVSRNPSRNRMARWCSGMVFGMIWFVDEVVYSNTVRIGYARVSGRAQDHQLQLDALVCAGCREVVVETASTRSERPKLRATLDRVCCVVRSRGNRPVADHSFAIIRI